MVQSLFQLAEAGLCQESICLASSLPVAGLALSTLPAGSPDARNPIANTLSPIPPPLIPSEASTFLTVLAEHLRPYPDDVEAACSFFRRLITAKRLDDGLDDHLRVISRLAFAALCVPEYGPFSAGSNLAEQLIPVLAARRLLPADESELDGLNRTLLLATVRHRLVPTGGRLPKLAAVFGSLANGQAANHNASLRRILGADQSGSSSIDGHLVEDTCQGVEYVCRQFVLLAIIKISLISTHLSRFYSQSEVSLIFL